MPNNSKPLSEATVSFNGLGMNSTIFCFSFFQDALSPCELVVRIGAATNRGLPLSHRILSLISLPYLDVDSNDDFFQIKLKKTHAKDSIG